MSTEINTAISTKTIAHPATWPTLTLEELFQNKTLLLDRWEFLESKRYPYANDVLKAIHDIEAVIQQKLTPQVGAHPQ